MAILGGAQGLGLSGLLAGQQLALNNFNLVDRFSGDLRNQFGQNAFAQSIGRGFSPAQAFAQLGQTTPFADQALINTGRALQLQSALAPQAILGAQQGNFGQLNHLSNLFGNVAQFGPSNFNATNALPLLGQQGLGQSINHDFNRQLLGLATQQFAVPQGLGALQSLGLGPQPSLAPLGLGQQPTFGFGFNPSLGSIEPSLGSFYNFGGDGTFGSSVVNTTSGSSSGNGNVRAVNRFGGGR